MFASQQYILGSGANGSTAIMLDKKYAVCGQGIDIGGFNFFMSVSSHLRVTQVIYQKIDEIGLYDIGKYYCSL